MGEWQPINTAPRPDNGEPCWIIGYTSWGQQVGKFHEWVGPCEWITDHFEFTNTDFDMFPQPTHWHEWPKPPNVHTVSISEASDQASSIG